jgi:hypothetical protein
MRVFQLPSDARVPPQLPMGEVMYCASVQVWAIHSVASQTVSPSTTAAP